MICDIKKVADWTSASRVDSKTQHCIFFLTIQRFEQRFSWLNLHVHLRNPLWQNTRLALVFVYISSRIISSQQIKWNVFIHFWNYLCSHNSSHDNIMLNSTSDTLITNPGSKGKKKLLVVIFLQNIASCTFHFLKDKCPVSGAKMN